MTEKQLFDKISKRMFGRSWAEASANHECIKCGEGILGFRDGKGAENYESYGYCQRCQDKYESELFPTDGTLSDFYQLCFACHSGEMENGRCNHCGAKGIA